MILRFARFNLVGAGGLVTQVTTVWMLASLAGMPVALATAIGVAVAVTHNFYWHRRWTWHDRLGPVVPAFAAFAGANGLVSLVGNVIITTGLVSVAELGIIAANLAAVAICAGLNFWLADRIAFREAPAGVQTSAPTRSR